MNRKMGPMEISHLILDTLRERLGDIMDDEQMNDLRRGIGVSLSAVHTLLIVTPKTGEGKAQAVGYAVDSIKRLIATLNNDMEMSGLGGVRMSMDASYPPPEVVN